MIIKMSDNIAVFNQPDLLENLVKPSETSFPAVLTETYNQYAIAATVMNTKNIDPELKDIPQLFTNKSSSFPASVGSITITPS